MKDSYILIYKSNGFPESKETEFELRNAFKKYDLHASYMTKRKFKTMSKVDSTYKSLINIHHQLSHSAFVIFAHPTEECKYKELNDVINLISLLKKEETIQNDETYFVGLLMNDTCLSHDQLEKLCVYNKELNQQPGSWMVDVLPKPISVMNYDLNNYIAASVNKKEYDIRTYIINRITTKNIYI